MGDIIKARKGLKANIDPLLLGEFGFTTDDERVYIGGNNGNIPLPNSADLSEKANNTDNTRTTTAKDVTGAINELNNNKANNTDNSRTTTAKDVTGAINELNKKTTDISFVGSKNIISNGGFERFANLSSWADDWTGVLGTATNSVGRDVITFYAGGCSQYLTKATANVADTMSLYQDITNVDVIKFLKGKTINLQIFMKSSNAGQYGIIQCRDSSGLAIAGGNVSTNTHTGDGTWQSLTCKCIVPSNTVSIRVYGCYYPANTGTGVVYTDSVKLQVGEIPMPIKEIEFQKDTSINVTTIPIKTTISDTDKRVIHSVTLRGLMPSDKVLLIGQFEVTNPQTYTIGVGKYIIRASNDTAVSGTDVFPSAPNMENITADIHHKVFQMLGLDTTHGGGTVTYNIIGYAVSDSAGTGHTCTVESGYGALYALIL